MQRLLLGLFATCIFCFLSCERNDIKKARRFSIDIMEHCRNDEYVELLPYLSKYILERHEHRAQSEFLEILRNGFPRNFISYEIQSIRGDKDGYLVVYELDNDGIFNMYFEKRTKDFVITKVELF